LTKIQGSYVAESSKEPITWSFDSMLTCHWCTAVAVFSQ